MAKKKTTKKPAKKQTPKKASKKASKKTAKKSPKKAAKKTKKKASTKAKKVKKASVRKSSPSKPRKAAKAKKAKKPIKKAKSSAKKSAVKKSAKKTSKATKAKTSSNIVKINRPAAVKKKNIAIRRQPLAERVSSPLMETIIVQTAPLVERVSIIETVSENQMETPFVAHETSLMEGDRAPYFEGYDQYGNLVRSIDFAGRNLILYFYPKDFTGGCTLEATSLRDEYRTLLNNNFAVVGVSADDMDTHRRFAEELMLPYPLLADTEKNIISAYDVWGPKQFADKVFDGIVRTTFVIGPDGMIKHIVRKVDNANAAQQILQL